MLVKKMLDHFHAQQQIDALIGQGSWDLIRHYRATEERMISELLSNTLDAVFRKIQRLTCDAPIQQVPDEIAKTTAIVENTPLEFDQRAQILDEQRAGMITEILP